MTESPTRTAHTAAWLAEALPRAGQAVEILALGRSGSSICGRTRVGAIKVLVPLDASPVRPVEGELFMLDVCRRTRVNGFWLLEGAIRSPRLNEDALCVEPLALIPRAIAHGGDGEPSEGGGLQYELESIVPRVPGFAATGFRAIEEIAAFRRAGEPALAELLAGELLARDLRCLEAHALLGSLHLDAPVEERWTERALRHYRVGATLGARSLPDSFAGRLPWRWRGNRAFLTCLYGWGRCLERVGDAGSAGAVFDRLLALAPEDPMGLLGQRS